MAAAYAKSCIYPANLEAMAMLWMEWTLDDISFLIFLYSAFIKCPKNTSQRYPCIMKDLMSYPINTLQEYINEYFIHASIDGVWNYRLFSNPQD